MNVVPLPKQDSCLHKPGHPTVPVAERMDRHQEKVREECPDHRMGFAELFVVDKFDIFIHEVVKLLVWGATVNATHLGTPHYH